MSNLRTRSAYHAVHTLEDRPKTPLTVEAPTVDVVKAMNEIINRNLRTYLNSTYDEAAAIAGHELKLPLADVLRIAGAKNMQALGAVGEDTTAKIQAALAGLDQDLVPAIGD